MKVFRDALVNSLSIQVLKDIRVDEQGKWTEAIRQMSVTMFTPEGCLGVWDEVVI
jgi:hypothetical protein